MDAIREIRSIAGKQCFVSGMSALVTDLKDLCEQEEPIYVALAVACACAAMMLLLDGWLVPFVFLASIGMAIVYNLGSNFFLGEISYITKALSAVLQLAVTMDYSIFLWHSYNEQLTLQSDHKEAMAVAIHNTFLPPLSAAPPPPSPASSPCASCPSRWAVTWASSWLRACCWACWAA